jgi:hypothetical protein
LPQKFFAGVIDLTDPAQIQAHRPGRIFDAPSAFLQFLNRRTGERSFDPECRGMIALMSFKTPHRVSPSSS